jgi:hypothetical protein
MGDKSAFTTVNNLNNVAIETTLATYSSKQLKLVNLHKHLEPKSERDSGYFK